MKEKIFVISLFAIFLIVGELFIRVYTKYRIFYDIEMTRYAHALKRNSMNSLIGHVHKENVKVYLMGVEIKTNFDGLRDNEYSTRKSSKHRILFLGDSLTLGWGVEKNQTFEYRLEQKLNEIVPTEIINFGVGNYNTQQEVEAFFEKGKKYDPDEIVLFYFINDVEITQKKSTLAFLSHSYLISFYWSRFRAMLVNLFSVNNYITYYKTLYEENSPGFEISKASIIRLKEYCINKGVKLKVVLLPELHNLKEYPFKHEHNMILSFLGSQGITKLDLQPFFSNLKDEPVSLWVALDDAHPNSRAHALIASYSFDFLAKDIGE